MDNEILSSEVCTMRVCSSRFPFHLSTALAVAAISLMAAPASAASLTGRYSGSIVILVDGENVAPDGRFTFNADGTVTWDMLGTWWSQEFGTGWVEFPALSGSGTYTYNSSTRVLTVHTSWTGDVVSNEDSDAHCTRLDINSNTLQMSTDLQTITGEIHAPLWYKYQDETGYDGTSYGTVSLTREADPTPAPTSTPTPTPTPAPADGYDVVFNGNAHGWTSVQVPGFVAPAVSVVGDALRSSPNGSSAVFGFWHSPVLAVTGGDTLQITWKIRSSAAQSQCPQMRLRVNETGLRHSTFDIVESSGVGEMSPAQNTPRDYVQTYSVPPFATGIELAFDLLSFNPNDDTHATVDLMEARIQKK